MVAIRSVAHTMLRQRGADVATEEDTKKSRIPFHIAALALLAPSLGLAEPAVMTRTSEAIAIVEAADQAERSAVVRRPNGDLVTVFPGPGMRNFAQVRPGSQVVVSYAEALAVSMSRAGTAPAAAMAGGARAAEGAQPVVAGGLALRQRLRIDAIDLGFNRVTFTTPAGEQRRATVRNPEMRRFMRTLRVGDQVDVTYAEIATITVRPPN